MWNVKTKVTLVIIGATGTVSKSLQAVPEQRTGERAKLRNYKKQPYWGTAQIVGKC